MENMHMENILVVAKREAEGVGMDWEFLVNRCKLSPLEWISNEMLMHSPGNSSYSPVMENGGG